MLSNYKSKKMLLIWALIVALIFCTVFCAVQSIIFPRYQVMAASSVYTKVLDDLQTDEGFKVDDYPVVANDYSIQLIQIAESSAKELFIYTYQPSGAAKNLKATSINISTAAEGLSYVVYKLELLSAANTLYKYKVKNFVVSNDEVRVYDISAICRPFDSSIDKKPDNDNTITEIAVEVGRRYFAQTQNERTVYSCTDVETIEITDKFVGFVRYDSGYIFHDEACDSHFVAFDTDKPIDKLMQADVYWVEQSYVYATDDSSKQPSLGEKIPNYITLSDEDDTVHYKGGGLKGSSYEWDRIESIDDFMNSVNVSSNVYSGVFTQGNNVSHLTSEAEDYLKGMKWVLRFVDTDYEVQKVEQVINGSKYSWHRATTTLISDVTILRLQFETDGKMYNLGVVDDRTIGSDKPVNDTNFEVSESNGLKDFLDKLKEIWAWLKKNGKIILYVILGIIGLCLMIPIIKVLYIFLSIPIRAAKGVSRHRRNKNNKNYRR